MRRQRETMEQRRKRLTRKRAARGKKRELTEYRGRIALVEVVARYWPAKRGRNALRGLWQRDENKLASTGLEDAQMRIARGAAFGLRGPAFSQERAECP